MISETFQACKRQKGNLHQHIHADMQSGKSALTFLQHLHIRLQICQWQNDEQCTSSPLCAMETSYVCFYI